MPTDLTLSQEVQIYIDTLDWEYDKDLPPEECHEADRAKKVVKAIVSEVIKSRETLADDKLKAVECLVQSHPDIIESLLDERYTRELIDAIPGYVRRTIQLSRMDATRRPSEVTNTYVREATRTFILSLPNACMALCRAALEQSLKENLGYQLSGTYTKLHELIDEAHKYHLLDKAAKEIARSVANSADDVLHEKPSNLDNVWEVLLNLRGLVQHIYSTQGHW
jgi:hypothetical protein